MDSQDESPQTICATEPANALLTVAQIAGGIVSGSLALIADDLHNFSDMASLVIAFAARKIARRPADERMTFGYGRIEIVAALINYKTLILVGVYLIYEGGMRIIDPPEVQGWTVVILGGVALVVDALTAALTWSMQKGSVNIRYRRLRMLPDRPSMRGIGWPMGLGSILGAVLGGMLVPYTSEPVLKLILGLVLVAAAIKTLYDHRG
ncbi:MAG: cation diffusion facilitator family transporter [Thalassospira sp.]|nr:cation diffusion facilitator family transporter [Thalassospira sp.]